MDRREFKLAGGDIPNVFKVKEVVRRAGAILPTDEVLLRAPCFVFVAAPPEVSDPGPDFDPQAVQLPYREVVFELDYHDKDGQGRLYILVVQQRPVALDAFEMQISGYTNEAADPGVIAPVPVIAHVFKDQLQWEVVPLPGIPDPDTDLPPGWTEGDCGDQAAILAALTWRCIVAVDQARREGGGGGIARRSVPASKRSLTRKIPPAGWEYRIVTLARSEAPAAATDQPLIEHGTHASPRWHTRRAHTRRLASGRLVPVRDCEVGHRESGVIVHDYRVT